VGRGGTIALVSSAFKAENFSGFAAGAGDVITGIRSCGVSIGTVLVVSGEGSVAEPEARPL